MYLYKMIITIIFFSGLQVHGQFFTMDATGSGDGLNESSTYSRLPLIDDNGDISTAVTSADGIKNLDETETNFTDTTLFSTGTPVEETTVKDLVSDTFTDSTVMQNSQTTISITNPPTTDLGISDTLVDSTTTSVLTVSSTMETTTQEVTTTEEDSTTTETTTTVKTTRKIIKTDSATEMPEPEYKPKPKEMVTKSPSTTIPTSTIQIAEDSDKRCVFMDADFQCDVEIACFGDGEIDCTEDEEMDADYSDIMDKRPSSFPDYDNITEGESNAQAIRQLFLNTHKIDLFKMFPLTPTSNESSTEKIEESTTTSIPFSNFTMTVNEELLDEENEQMNETMDAADIESILDAEVSEKFDHFLPPTESTEKIKIFYDAEQSSLDNNSSNRQTSKDLEGMGNDGKMTTSFSNDYEIENLSQINETTIHQDYTNNETLSEFAVTSVDMTTSEAPEKILQENETKEDVENQPIIARTKREKNLNSNYKVSELEGSKKKISLKACKLNGKIVCTPRPTSLICTGKTFCQVPPQAIETVEKPAQEKGLEKWTIAVIIICAITAAATIFLLIYLVFTSYKKLKVQPQNGVTTLNYVNNAQP